MWKTASAHWTRHVERETKRNFHHFVQNPKEFNSSIPWYQMGMLGTVLAEDLQIQYNPERERQLLEKPIHSQSVQEQSAFFSSSTDVFIHGLLSGKHYGTCASMPFLYAAVGRRLGYPVTIAARKYHLYVRYEAGNDEHLNLEATENRGFSTPTDEEYRTGQYPMTQAEIDGCGWLRPLSNKETLGICLLNRSMCLRSMKRYDDEVKTLADASRYLPDTALMRRVIARNQELARNLHTADRWDNLWDEVEKLELPTAGPMFEHFQNGKLAVQLFMNQSTNLADIEKSVTSLRAQLRSYWNEISDDPVKSAEAYGPPQPPANQRVFLTLLESGPQPAILIPREQVPKEYCDSVPERLQMRLSGLNDAEKIVGEMWAFHREEEVRQQDEQNRARMAAREQALRVLRQRGISPSGNSGQQAMAVPSPAEPLGSGQNPIPAMYREWITPEIASRLTPADIWLLQQNEKNLQAMQQGKELRRMTASTTPTHISFRIVPASELPQEPLTGRSPVEQSTTPDLILTPQPGSQITPMVNEMGRP